MYMEKQCTCSINFIMSLTHCLYGVRNIIGARPFEPNPAATQPLRTHINSSQLVVLQGVQCFSPLLTAEHLRTNMVECNDTVNSGN